MGNIFSFYYYIFLAINYVRFNYDFIVMKIKSFYKYPINAKNKLPFK